MKLIKQASIILATLALLAFMMMAESGLTPAQILRAATGNAARAIKVDGVGTLQKGAWADFVVLDRDPSKDIRNTRSMASVWIAGNQVKGTAPQKMGSRRNAQR